jgi:hypothetical protein
MTHGTSPPIMSDTLLNSKVKPMPVVLTLNKLMVASQPLTTFVNGHPLEVPSR